MRQGNGWPGDFEASSCRYLMVDVVKIMPRLKFPKFKELSPLCCTLSVSAWDNLPSWADKIDLSVSKEEIHRLHIPRHLNVHLNPSIFVFVVSPTDNAWRNLESADSQALRVLRAWRSNTCSFRHLSTAQPCLLDSKLQARSQTMYRTLVG
jgi:hypothetical protein